jgi:hypothetical protein
LDPPSTKFAVSNAVVKKMAVAINERGERRERPHSMWPEVQPRPFYILLVNLFLQSCPILLTFVPHPNRKPTPNVAAAEAQEFGCAG